jgi:hypothetical protein
MVTHLRLPLVSLPHPAFPLPYRPTLHHHSPFTTHFTMMAFELFNYTHPPSTNDLIPPITVLSIIGPIILFALVALVYTQWFWNVEQPAPAPAPALIELGPREPHS